MNSARSEPAARAKPAWAPQGSYFAYEVLAGTVLGLFGALVSLVFNIVGALVVPPPAGLAPDPLNLIRVYLTFPMKDAALTTDNGVALAIGCCLYLFTGMALGVPFQVAQARILPNGTLRGRLILATVVGLLVWIVNFYCILSWLQPLLFGDRWIVRLIPWWVGMLTHLVFGWTMALMYQWAVFAPYRTFEEQS